MGGVTFYGLQRDWRGSSVSVWGSEVSMLTENTSGIYISELIPRISFSWVQNCILYLQHKILHGLLEFLEGSWLVARFCSIAHDCIGCTRMRRISEKEPNVLRGHGAMNYGHGATLGRSICAAHCVGFGMSLGC